MNGPRLPRRLVNVAGASIKRFPGARWGAVACLLAIVATVLLIGSGGPGDRSTSPQTPLRRLMIVTQGPRGLGPGRFQTVSPSTYVVQPGDTLSLIASRFRVSENELQALNHLVDPESVYAGQMLVIPQSSAN